MSKQTQSLFGVSTLKTPAACLYLPTAQSTADACVRTPLTPARSLCKQSHSSQRLRAESATQKNLLFEHLLRATKQAIFESMTPLEVAAGTSIIKQGDTEAKTFYVLASGCCEVLLQTPAWGTEPRQVLTYDPGRYTPRSPNPPTPAAQSGPALWELQPWLASC